ncbi:WD repeat-containing protein l(2)05287 [Anticarsia gemmatalis]|uniref:WD repeat-containing protein l(2)05287 n=1 Tax=Anticarsia gemmatalis TaxID=129554 RepID=UPI003F76A066
MGVKVGSDNTESVKYNFHRKAGRSIIDHRPVFSPDGESVAIIVENIVRVYNIQTGDCVRTLETENVAKELIALQFPENDNYNLYGCSDEGVVTIWTWENGAVLRETKLRLPPNSKVVTFDLVESNECCITYTVPKQKHCSLCTYSTKTGELLYAYNDTRALFPDMVRVSLGVCAGEKYVAITNGTKYLFIQNLQQPHLKTQIINHNGYRIMSVSAHQKANAVAITDTLGRCTVFRGYLFDYKKVAREVLHWHFLPPLATCFSIQGNYLYSGGMEKVLVKWTIGNLSHRANEKAFIPRLPGMVKFITTDNNHVAVTLTNNSVVIANAQLRVVSTILECGGVSPAARAVGGALVYHQPLEALITAGRTGHLQLYSTTTDKVLYNLDITEMNSLPSERWNLLPLETEVTCAAVSGNGEWLVTSEYRNDGIIYPEEKLKFWHAQYNNATPFQLNTVVGLSHGGCNVVSLALNNKGEFCVSAGADQKFRIWKRETSQTRKKIAWACLTACYYSSGIGQFISNNVLNDFKDAAKYKPGKDGELPYLREVNSKNDIIKRLFNIHKEHSLASEMGKVSIGRDDEYTMGGVAISQDGSLIAAWFGSKLTLWDTHLCNLRTTLSHPALRPKGVHVQFGNKDAAHYLVCTTEKCVAVWSLLSLTVKWLVQINPTCLAAHRFSNKIAVATTNNDVYVFTPHNSTPILTKKQLVAPSTGVFKQCAFGTCYDDDIRLYLMRNDSEIYCIEPEASDDGRLEVISHRKLPRSNFGALLAEQQLSEVQSATAVDASAIDFSASASSSIAQFSLASPHMVPPVSLLCTSFLQRLSGMDLQEQTDDDQEDKPMEIDEDSSDDEDGDKSKLNGPYAPKVTELWTPNYEAVKEKKLNKIMSEPFLDLHSTSSMFGV